MNTIKTGALIQALRKSKGLTQQELALELNVSSKTVSKWECGDALPEITTLILLSEYFDVSLDELLKGEKTHQGKTLSEDTTQRFQSKKERFIKQKFESKITMFTLISMGLYLAMALFIFLMLYSPSLIYLIFAVLFGVSSLIVFIIGFSSPQFTYDESIKEETLLSIKIIKFKWGYLYLMLWLTSLVSIPIFSRMFLFGFARGMILFVLIAILVYFYLLHKRYGVNLPPMVDKVIQIQSRYNIVYLVLLGYMIQFLFGSESYSYHHPGGYFEVFFTDVFQEVPILMGILFIVFLGMSLLVLILKMLKRKTKNIEILCIMLSALLAWQMVEVHHINKLAWLRSSGYNSFGNSPPFTFPIFFIMSVGFITLFLSLLLPILAVSHKQD